MSRIARPKPGGRAGRIKAALAAVAISLLAACGGGGPMHRGESFEPDPRYRRVFKMPAAQVCEAARLVLLGQGYVVRSLDANALSLDGNKQLPGDKQSHTVLQVVVNCVPQSQGTRLFVTAVEESFEVRKSSESSALGLPMVGPITVSRSSTTENQIKSSGETVRDERFFDRFFTAVQAELGQR